jgi:hypothetical protein
LIKEYVSEKQYNTTVAVDLLRLVKKESHYLSLLIDPEELF